MSVPYKGVSGVAGTPGLLGENSKNGDGVWGDAQPKGRGVVGVSSDGAGVWGDTERSRAVVGVVRERGDAVWGETKAGRGVVGVSGDEGAGVWGDSQTGRAVVGIAHERGDGVWGETKTGRGVIGVCEGEGTGVQGETNAVGSVAGVAGYAINEHGTGPGVVGQSMGSGTGVFGRARRDAGVTGYHGDPLLRETTVGSAAARAGVFGASEDGPGLMGYARSRGSAAVVAFGGVRATAMTYPFAGEFFGDVQVNGRVFTQDVILSGADCAEHFDVVDVEHVEPGDVMVIASDGSLAQSRAPYDKTVAGVVSGAGSFRPGIILDQRAASYGRLPLALMGKVYCKVDAQYGSIELGDLLTTSPTVSHAMRAADPARAFGTVVGKALGTLASGAGLVPILVCLQ